MDKNTIKELKEIIDSTPVKEISVKKKVCYSKKSGQFSIKIPKSIALKVGLHGNSKARIILNSSKKLIPKLFKNKMINKNTGCKSV